MHPLLFQTTLFGALQRPWSLHTYGLLIAVGFLLGMNLARRQAEREGEDGEAMVDLTFYLLLAGLLGARLVFILTQLSTFVANPIEILMFWRGGLVWYGGFLGALLYLVYQTRKTGLAFFKTVDLLIVPMALAHGFGRLGCLAAGCCYGYPTQLPWGIVFPPHAMAQEAQWLAGQVHALAPSLPVHPTQLYEAGAEFLLFGVLVWARQYKRFHGQLFLLWLGIYPILRSAIEMFRGDKERGVFGALSTSQYISVGIGVAAFALALYFRARRGRVVAVDGTASSALA